MRIWTIGVLGVAVLAGAAALYVWSRVTYMHRGSEREIMKVNMREIADAVASFRLKHGRLPATLQEICGKFIDCDEPPKDSWGNDFVFAPSADGSFELESLGADGLPGGSDADADISLVQPRTK